MKVNHAIIKMGPMVSDPADIIKLILVEEDGTQHFIGDGRLWSRFLIWGIRRHIRRITR